jgi:hypothetical protein
MNNAGTLQFAMAMIDRLGETAPDQAATMAIQLHQYEELTARIDRAAEGIGALVAANIAAQSARASAREEREEREASARIAEIETRIARDAASAERCAEEHEIRMAEMRARIARDAARDARDQSLNRL